MATQRATLWMWLMLNTPQTELLHSNAMPTSWNWNRIPGVSPWRRCAHPLVDYEPVHVECAKFTILKAKSARCLHIRFHSETHGKRKRVTSLVDFRWNGTSIEATSEHVPWSNHGKQSVSGPTNGFPTYIYTSKYDTPNTVYFVYMCVSIQSWQIWSVHTRLAQENQKHDLKATSVRSTPDLVRTSNSFKPHYD